MNSSLCTTPVVEDRTFLNFTDTPYPWSTNVFIEFDAVATCKVILYLIVFAIALLGNILVIVIVFTNKPMRIATNYYLVNLAVADVLIACFCMWAHLIKNLTLKSYILGPFMCKADAFVQSTSMTASVLSLMAISCDRFVAVIFPLRARITQRSASAVITFIWIVSAVISVPFIIYKKHSTFQWADTTSMACGDIWPVQTYYDETSKKCVKDEFVRRLYYTICTVTWFFLPVTVMTSAYIALVWRLWFSRNLMNMGDTASSVHDRSKKKVIKMVIIVLCGFIVCWMPLQILILYSEYTHSNHVGNYELPSWFTSTMFFAYFIAYFNSALNPIIYCGFNGNYRQGLLNLLKCETENRAWVSTRTKQSTMGSASYRINHGGTLTGGISSNAEYLEYVDIPMKSLKYDCNKRSAV